MPSSNAVLVPVLRTTAPGELGMLWRKGDADQDLAGLLIGVLDQNVARTYNSNLPQRCTAETSLMLEIVIDSPDPSCYRLLSGHGIQ